MDQGQYRPPAAAILASHAPSRSDPQARWLLCFLLLVLTAIGGLDNGALGTLRSVRGAKLGFDPAALGWITFAHTLGLTAALVFVGRLVDRVGVKASLIGGVLVCSVATTGHALAGTLVGLAGAGLVLGIGESVYRPASIKAIAEWFPVRQRALATAISELGDNLATLALPLLLLAGATFAWQAPFVLVGCLGFGWIALWVLLYSSLGGGGAVADEKEAQGGGWLAVFRHRQFWAYALGTMTSRAAFSLNLWVPSLLLEKGVTAPAASVLLLWPMLAMTLGSLAGGWLSAFFMTRGRSVGWARLRVMTAGAACSSLLLLGTATDDPIAIVSIVTIASAGHGLWSPNLTTLASDLFPTRLVGTVVSAGLLVGTFGGGVASALTGLMLANTDSHAPVFLITALLHPLALLVIVSLAGRDLRPVRIGGPAAGATAPATGRRSV